MLAQRQRTVPSEIRDFPEWHHGRETYAVWILDCEKSVPVQEKFKAAQAHLDDYLLKPYHRQPHITLFVCGFLVESPQHSDDFPQSQIDAQIQALERANLDSFDIQIGALNSFASAPFLEVRDPDFGIAALRSVLGEGAREFRTTSYHPHLTVGLYADSFPSKEVLARMERFISEPVRWKVEKITLSTYQAKEVTGKLSSKYEKNLKLSVV